MQPSYLRWLIPLILVVLLLPACRDTADDIADPPLATTSTTAVATTSTTAVATTTTTAATTTTAEPSDPTEIQIDLVWHNNVDGAFAASGGAVDAGIMCSEGKVDFVVYEVVEEEPDRWFDEEWGNDFICSDGSGSLYIHETVHGLAGEKIDKMTGEWEVVSGTGAYEGLTGTGTSVGTCSFLPIECNHKMKGSIGSEGG